jgi:Xaa-Pro aminopeptidase
MHVKSTGSTVKKGKKIYSGIFRDGGAGTRAKSRFRERRRKLMKKENQLMVLTGVPYGPGAETTWTYAYAPTYQEPTVMYLTGVNQSEVILLLDPGSKESDEILFVKKKDPRKEFWDGIRFGVGDPASIREVKRVTGIKEVQDIDDFDEIFRKRLAKRKKKAVGTFWLESTRTSTRRTIKTDHNWKFKKRIEGLLKKAKAPKGSLSNIMQSHFELRLPLDVYDVANTLKAQTITGKAFKETLKNFKKFDNECRVQGFLEGQMLMDSPYGLSFPGIIAAGHNATVLHYMKNDDPIEKGELVLMDFGVRWMTMHLNDACWETLQKGLDEKFYKLGGKSKMNYKGRPHGVSHLIGEQEHDGDPFRDYGVEPMKPGWLISNEPGLYGQFRWKHKGKVYDEEIGIRIEDNLLITKTGCANLSKGIPKRVSEIERLMARPRRK